VKSKNGRANPGIDTLGKIAAALGVHPHELFEE
jgi:transcriptional regulator with XRE-family HTH domain